MVAEKKVYLTRIAKFSACHRLHSPMLTSEKNAMIYGPCNNLNGHGHNYTVEVTVYGPVSLDTGMVMNLTDLKEVINAAIMDKCDHKNLDKDIEYFQKVPSTTENLAVFLWDSVKSLMNRPEILYEIKIHETDKNIVTYRGDSTQ